MTSRRRKKNGNVPARSEQGSGRLRVAAYYLLPELASVSLAPELTGSGLAQVYL